MVKSGKQIDGCIGVVAIAPEGFYEFALMRQMVLASGRLRDSADTMESINRAAVVVKPGKPFLDWLHRADPTFTDFTPTLARGAEISL